MHSRDQPIRRYPVRTCIGCRQRSPGSELLRIVAVGGDSGPAGSRLVPDPRRRLTGRGAHLHPDIGCLELAERRRAFGRALRLTGPADAAAIREYVVSSRGPGEHSPGEHSTEEHSTEERGSEQ